MSHERSVVYVLDKYELGLNELGIVTAQQYALHTKLPLAVVAIVPGADIPEPPLVELQAIEQMLDVHQIPLMTMIGDRGQALHGLAQYLAPRIVPQDKTPTEDSLHPHPYAWPNQVQSAEELFRYAAKHPEMCVF